MVYKVIRRNVSVLQSAFYYAIIYLSTRGHPCNAGRDNHVSTDGLVIHPCMTVRTRQLSASHAGPAGQICQYEYQIGAHFLRGKRYENTLNYKYEDYLIPENDAFIRFTITQ